MRKAGTRSVRAFLIQHLGPLDALPVAPPDAPQAACALAVDHTVVASTHLAASLALWRDTLGLDLRATVNWPPPQGPRQLNFLRLGESILELAGEREPQRPGARDLLWGVSYRVGDVAAAVDRLRDAGLTVSDPRSGNAPRTLVADLKPGFSHDVRTLFIQKDLPP